MPDRITQIFDINASQALQTLEQLDKGFTRFQARLDALAQSMQKVNTTTKGVDKIGDAFNRNIPKSVQHTERLTTSLNLLSRIVFTQAIVRGLSQIRRTLERTGEQAVQFQKQVALITTIADGAKFDEIAAQVHRLSNEFNLPLLATAEGLYAALSNQVGNFGDSVRFSEEAARFAKATNSSLKDSVDLLSAALKGYRLGVEDVDKVSSIFFATIDKGRINASELANSFGRVDTIAADIGVSLEETGAALASISVRGTKTSEALTQFRAILSALQKPSDTMEKSLSELGFTSSEVAIKTLGLTGVLDALSKSTGGSGEQLAKLFPNIRGLSGVASLTSDDLRSLSDNIREMTIAGRDFNKEKFLQATATDAERVTEQLNILKNQMTVGLGQATLSVVDDLFKLTGGANNLIAAGKVAVPTIAGVSAAMLALKGSTALANAELSLLSKGFGALALFGVAAGVGTSIGSFIESKRVESLFKELNALEAANKKFLADFEANLNSERDAFNQLNVARVQAALQSNRELNRLYIQDVANAKSAAEQKAAFDKFKSGSNVDEDFLGAVLGRKISTPDQVSQGIIDAQKRAAELGAELNKALAGEQGINKLREELGQSFSDLDRLQSSRAVAPDTGLLKQFAPIFDELRRLRGDSQITEEELSKVIEARNKLGAEALTGGGVLGTGFANLDKIGFASSLNALDSALSKLVAIKQTQETIGNSTAISSELQLFNDVLQKAAPDVKFQAAATALQAAVAPSQSIAAAMESAATAAERAAAAASQISAPVNRAFGGPMYFAKGGRGVDTIPAMLSKGEFVVNAASTGKFFSQLQAINAGHAPVFRDNGGTVNNNQQTFGDININGAGNPARVGREVMRQIRRESRRGTSRL